MMKCCVFFVVWTEFLNIIQKSFGNRTRNFSHYDLSLAGIREGNFPNMNETRHRSFKSITLTGTSGMLVSLK
jgi:hypothetical protein